MKNFLNWFTKEESGQGMVEYGLIVALISIVVIAVLTATGTNLNKLFEKIRDALATA